MGSAVKMFETMLKPGRRCSMQRLIRQPAAAHHDKLLLVADKICGKVGKKGAVW